MKMFEGPTEASLDESQRQVVEQAKLAFRELEKLTKNISLYGSEHQSVERFQLRFHETLTELLESQEQVNILVGPYEFSLHDQVIHQNPNPENNFIYKFYMDGIRHLVFDQGLELEEVIKFVNILLTNWEDSALFEDDSVTLLWDQGFDHIDHLVIDSFQEDAKEGEEHLYTIPGVMNQIRIGAKEASRGARQRLKETSNTGRGARKSHKRSHRTAVLIPEGTSLQLNDLDRFEEHPFAMDEQEFLKLKSLITTTGRETLEKFIEILFKVNLVETDVHERESRVVALFDRIAELLLEGKRIGDLERLLRQVHHLSGPEQHKIPENIEAIRRIFAHWSSQSFVEKVMAPLNDPKSNFSPSILAICQLLNREAAPAIVRCTGQLEIPERKEAMLAILPGIIQGGEQAVARLLKEVDQQFAHQLFKLLRSSKDAHVLSITIYSALKNPEPGVRFESLSTLPLKMATQNLKPLLQALQDPAKLVRSKAIHILARIRSPEVHEHIMQAIKQKSFARRELDEKRRYFSAAALTASSMEFFIGLFQSSALLKRGQDELRHCAAIALSLRLYRAIEPLFKKELKRRMGSEIVASACRWGLQHMQQDRELRTQQLYDIFFKGELNTEPSEKQR